MRPFSGPITIMRLRTGRIGDNQSRDGHNQPKIGSFLLLYSNKCINALYFLVGEAYRRASAKLSVSCPLGSLYNF